MSDINNKCYIMTILSICPCICERQIFLQKYIHVFNKWVKIHVLGLSNLYITKIKAKLSS